MTQTPGDNFETPQAAIDKASRSQALDAVYRCLDRMLASLARDYAHCGKAACARARRCRGFACKLEEDKET